MKRRYTSVVDAQRVALATPAAAAGPRLGPADGAALYAQGLRHWGLRVARQLVLSGVPLGTDDDAAIRGPGDLHADQREQQQHADVARRWQIATRQLNGNPAPTGERSSLSWFRPDGDQRYFWRKVYAQGYEHLQSNEHHVLLALGTRNRNLTGDLRQHVGWLKHLGTSGHGTSVIQVETVDGGPNLDMWQDFAPCMGTGANALPLPLFANPTFLAALTRQALIALEALAQLKLVHGDLKPGNLCLAMPKGIDPSARLISGDLDLRHLQLRLIDFEFSFFEDFPRRVIALRPPQVVDGQAWEYNANFSPFVHACHRAAMGLTNRHDIQRCLGAIDWGADLWALGDMLEQYALQAKEFIAAYGSAFSSAFGFNSLEHAFADQALAGLLQQCGQLLQFAEGLKAHERSAAHAGELNLPDRIDLPHQRLWLELEGLFSLLGPRAASSLCTLNFFNPSIAPGSEDDAPATDARASTEDVLSPIAAPAPRVRKVSVVRLAHSLPADLTELSVPNGGDVLPSFVLIPNPGRVTLGNGNEVGNKAITADIRHRYAMGQTAVTVGQWKVFWNAPDRDYQPVMDSQTHYCNWDDKDCAKDDRHPVRCVNALDAKAYARWFAKRHGAALGVRVESIGLPSELEWEFAARGGRYAQRFLWDAGASDAVICQHAQFGKCPDEVIPVGSRLKNGYNLYDMIGNAWEWTATHWGQRGSEIHGNFRDSLEVNTTLRRADKPVESAVTFVVPATLTLRGGWFGTNVDGLALAYRSMCSASFRGSKVGFRLVARIAP